MVSYFKIYRVSIDDFPLTSDDVSQNFNDVNIVYLPLIRFYAKNAIPNAKTVNAHAPTNTPRVALLLALVVEAEVEVGFEIIVTVGVLEAVYNEVLIAL